MQKSTITLIFAGFTCLVVAKPKSATQVSTDVRVEHNVAYLAAGRDEKADLYSPLAIAKDARLPAVVWIHGGGWNGGSKSSSREVNVCNTLALNGYIAMSIDYKLSSEKIAVWPQNLWDCKTAVRWLRKNAERLGIDPDRIGVMGGSACGHLASMVALSTPEDKLDPVQPYGDISCAVRCCVNKYLATN